MRKLSKKFQKAVVGILIILFISVSVAFLPFSFAPFPTLKAPEEVSATGIPFLDPGRILEMIKKALIARLKLAFIRRIQAQVQSAFKEIRNQCPPWLKLRGTNVCRRIVDDWANFFSDALYAARKEVLNDIDRSLLSADAKAVIKSALGPLEKQAFDTIIAAAGPPATNENTWDNFTEALKPEKNILGQLLIAHDELLEEEAGTAAAVAKQGEIIGDYVCPGGEVGLTSGTGEVFCPGGYQQITPSKVKEAVLEAVSRADVDLAINVEDFEAIFANFVANTLVDQILGPKGFFGATVAKPPSPPLPSPLPISLSAEPQTINPGQSSTLTWAAPSAPSCTASGGWSDIKPAAGQETVAPPTTTTYILTCGTQSASVTINVISGTPIPIERP